MKLIVKRFRSPHRKRGAALIAVLWLGMLAALLLVGVRRAASVSLATGHADLATVQAHWLARAGIEQAIDVLGSDSRDTDSSLDVWYDDEFAFSEIELGPGTFSVIAPPDAGAAGEPRFGLIDHAGLLNVNTADEAQFAAMPSLDAQAGASILDWRDKDSDTRAGGAEAAHYQRLRVPYQIRNGPMHTVAELRLVKGIDRQTYEADAQMPGLRSLVTVFGRERNRTGYDAQRVNVNTASEADLRAQLLFSEALARGVVAQRGRRKFQNLMELLNVQPQANPQRSGSRRSSRPQGNDSGNSEDASDDSTSAEDEDTIKQIDLDWLAKNLDSLTLVDDDFLPARININTAPRDVLLTLPQITHEAVDGIISHRQSVAGPFYGVGDLRRAAGMTDDMFKAIAELCTVRSGVFAVTSVGMTPRGIRQRITAIIDRSEEPVRIIYWHQSES